MPNVTDMRGYVELLEEMGELRKLGIDVAKSTVEKYRPQVRKPPSPTMKTTVTARGQTVEPAKIRKDHQISAQAQLEWLDDGETIRAARGSTTGLHQRLLAERE